MGRRSCITTPSSRSGILGFVDLAQQIQEIVRHRLLRDIVIHAAQFAPDRPLPRPDGTGFFVGLFLVRHGRYPIAVSCLTSHSDGAFRRESPVATYAPFRVPFQGSKRPPSRMVPAGSWNFFGWRKFPI